MTGGTKVTVTDEFHDDLNALASQRTLDHVRECLVNLAAFPGMGRRAESPTLVGRFGEGVRTLVCGSYLLVYQHREDVVSVLALYPARLVR